MQPQRRRDAETDAEEEVEKKIDYFDFLSRNNLGAPEDPLTRAGISACIEVHRELDPGLTEVMYEEALCHEFDPRGIRYARQVPLPVAYKGKPIGTGRRDLLIEGRLILDLKSCEWLTATHRARVITYLRITGLQLGLLVNFDVAVLKDGIKRIILSKPT